MACIWMTTDINLESAMVMEEIPVIRTFLNHCSKPFQNNNAVNEVEIRVLSAVDFF